MVKINWGVVGKIAFYASGWVACIISEAVSGNKYEKSYNALRDSLRELYDKNEKFRIEARNREIDNFVKEAFENGKG